MNTFHRFTRRLVGLCSVLWFGLWLGGCATEWSGKVVAVSDGDTISVLRHKTPVRIRLHGIDCPEAHQPFGQRAKQFTARMALGQLATVRTIDRDRYGRTVAQVFVQGRQLNAALLAAGLAWHYRQYDRSPEYILLERHARAERRGLWADPRPTPPWIWRRTKKKRKARARQALPTCDNRPCPIHGNIGSRVFHRRGCRHFACKQCTAGFTTTREAEAAGYRAHRECAKNLP